jgi:hypothetical protein
MAHLYCLPVCVERSPDGTPASFVWHGASYEVAEVLSTWHLRDRWWTKGVESVYGGRGHSDRYYFRVRCPDHQVFDLYYDAAQNVWILETAHD